MEQTAVEFVVEQLSKEHPIYTKNDIINQAKEIEQQKKDEYAIGFADWLNTLEAKYLIGDLILIGELNKNPKTKELLEIFKNK